METKNEIPIHDDDFIDCLIEQIRSSFSHMLKEHLRVCKNYDQLKADIKEEQAKKRFYHTEPSFHDENGRINWEIIRRFIPSDFENHIRKEYSMLNENEVRLCFLLFFNASNKTIAAILPYKQKSIRSMIHKVKKKAGIIDMKENRKKYLEKYLSTKRQQVKTLNH